MVLRTTWRAQRMRPISACVLRCVTGIGLVVLNAGCYRAVPITLEEVRRNEQVNVLVSDAAATRLSRDLGAYTPRLHGPIKQERGDSVSVSVLIAREYAGVQLDGTRLELFLARAEITGFQRRQLSRTRTILVSLGSIALFGAVVGTVIQAGDPNNPPDNPFPQPPAGARFGLRFSIP